jgi:vacuolar-type H+-ATPase subunit H
MKQMLIEENIALLDHRLTSSKTLTPSNLVDHIMNDIDKTIDDLNATVQTSPNACSLFNEIYRLQSLKSDIIKQAIFTSRRMIEDLNTTMKKEQKKFISMNRLTGSKSEWKIKVLNAIEIRRLHMIHRVNLIIQYKLNA